MEGDELRSVRVEVDGENSGSAAPAITTGGRGPAHLLVPLFGGALLLVALILAVRPSTGESADGSARTAPTTVAPSTIAPQPAVEEPSEVDGAEPEGPQGHSKVVGIHGEGISSVVRADVGYLASSWGIGNSAALLYRSIDGIEWSAVDAVFPAEVESARSNGMSLSHLRRTSTGYAAIAQVFPQDEANGSAPSLVRLVSEDGQTWKAPSQATPGPESLHIFPVLHTESLWAYGSAGPDAQIAELLERYLVDVEVISNIRPCWLNALSDEAAEVYSCGGEEPIGLTADDLVEGVSFRQLSRCVDALQGSGTYEVQFVDTQTGESLHAIELLQTSQLAEGISTSGAIAGVVADSFRDRSSGCDGLLDIVEEDIGPVMVWDAGSATPHNVELPEGARSGQFNGWARSYVRQESLFIFASGQTWILNLTSLEWSEGPEVGHSIDAAQIMSEDGTTIFSAAFTNDVLVVDVDSGTSRTVETDLRGEIHWFAYADDRMALVHMPTGTYRIDLSAD